MARAWVILDDLGRMGGAIIRSRRHMDREGNACGRAASSKAGDEQLQLAAGQGEPLGLVDLKNSVIGKGRIRASYRTRNYVRPYLQTQLKVSMW